MNDSQSKRRPTASPSNLLRKTADAGKLDRIDREILAALANNARLSNKELAAKVGLAPSSALERFRRLTREGWLRGFHADVDPRAFGLGLEAMISVRLKQHSRDQFEAFRLYVQTLPEVVAAYHMAGANDFLVHVRARDAEHLRDFAIDAFTTRPEIGHLETALVFEHLRGGAPIWPE
ncbi:MAG: Lrp/AsnC family transcriptional regulator [Thermoanaerobaculia bacterium]|jgi:DNA-binding Lrp family transcriptional regulator|nr:Lrp/AsnC family transcriptional regulator [Thermoanaerobaculia bacterium]MBP9823333.1 Lrp/AsnC family transcriptional regulator [Thermoanaerobaculia bacterium]